VSVCVYAIAGWLIFFCFSIYAQDFKTINDGIEYAEIKRGTEIEPVKINLLRLDLTKVRLDVIHAMDAAIGTETVSSMATRHGAFAAINAGFFRLDKSIFAGDAAGVLMIDRKLLSESYNYRIALFIGNKESQTDIRFANLNTDDFVKINKKIFKVTGINRQRKEDELIIFTPEFHRTTLTNEKGIEIVVKNSKIIQIITGKGNNIIPLEGYVLSATGEMQKEILSNVRVRIGLKVKKNTIEISSVGKILSEVEDIVGGVPQLIKNGKIEITWEQEKSSKSFVETRHPRTAVAKLKDGKFLMITVDGRQQESVGMNLNELAALLLEFGAVDAMNLDGGGSTTMFAGGKIVNKPSDKQGERKVSDAILVFPRKKQ
jgi:hypothetical protein